MATWKHYHTPQTVDDALALLAQYEGNARIIGGGTDLMIDLKHGDEEAPDALVDVTAIQSMAGISHDDDQCLLGAAVTHNMIVRTTVLVTRATCLVESCGEVGGPQIRNVGTIGGNVAHALPAGDGTTSLVALNAEAEVAWSDGRREWMPVIDLFEGPGVSVLDSTKDVLVGFRFPLVQAGEGTAFKRIMRPQGVALPILGCAVWVKLAEDSETFTDVRVCIGPVARTPILAEEVTQALVGKPANAASVDLAVQAAQDSLHPRTSKYRATAEYRTHMIETLLRGTLPLAVQRAQTGTAVVKGVGLT